MNICLFGPPGSGKGTQASLLIKEFGFIHISTGELLRESLKRQDSLGVAIKKTMAEGALVPDEMVVELVRKFIGSYSSSALLLFDGFPRTIEQSNLFDQLLESNGRSLDMLINLEVDIETIVERISGRRVCEKCGTIWHIVLKPTKNQGICDLCCHELIQRDDDQERVVRQRYNTFLNASLPIVDKYDRLGKAWSCSGSLSIEDTFQKVKMKINSIKK